MIYQPIVLALMASLLLAAPSLAASNIWTIDPAQSAVTFTVSHMAFSAVSGRFKNFSGTVTYDGKNLRDAEVQAKINTHSIDTQSRKRDEHLQSKSFFDAAEFPAISFKSQKVVPDQTGAFKINGVLSIHGYAREVCLDAQPLQEVRSTTATAKRLVTSATTVLNRKDFAISMGPLDRGGALIGDKIQVTLSIQLVPCTTSANPVAGTPRGGSSNNSSSNAATSNAATSNTRTPNTAASNAGTPNSGTPNTGIPSSGIPSSGIPSTGTPSSGTPHTATPSPGSTNNGSPTGPFRRLRRDSRMPLIRVADRTVYDIVSTT
jgi:polyisoprenoid-binding protein YceI